MNLLLFETADLDGSRLRLDERQEKHLREVLRVEVGAQVRVGCIGEAPGAAGPTGVGEVVRAEKRGVELEVRLDPQAEAEPLSGPETRLLLALPRPRALGRILQMVATFGVRDLELVNSWRVEKSFFSSNVLEVASIRRHLILGAEQGCTTRLPSVRIHHRLLPFLEGLGPKAAGEERWIAHPEAVKTPEEGFSAASERVSDREERSDRSRLLAIGPEGGWIDPELESFQQAGFEAVALGPWILRVETAVAVALGQAALVDRLRQPRGASAGRSS